MNMKTAVIIISPIGHNVSPSLYLNACAEKVKADGYTVLHPTDWNEYKNIDIKELTDKIIHGIDAFYLFVDFGASPFMVDLVTKFVKKDKEEYQFIKEIKVEAVLGIKSWNLSGVLLEVSQAAKIPVEILKLKTRKREIVEARQIYFVRAKLFTTASLAVIGRLVGKDHATVLHGIKVVNNVIELKRKYDDWFCEKRPVKSIVPKKIEFVNIKPEPFRRERERPVKNPIYAGIVSCTNREYSGYREHQL